jgi:hypothetical protein
MVRALVLRGMGVGALAGLLAFGYARIFAEPVIEAAIAYEGARDQAKEAAGHAMDHHAMDHEGPEIFSRAIQADVGLGLGIVLFGAAVGAFFAVAFCMAYGRTGRIRPRRLALLVALGGFVTLYLIPSLKYPANPPAIGNPDTIGQRTGLYVIMVVAAVLLALVAVGVGQRLQARLGTWNATVLAILSFVVLTGILMALMPNLGQLTANTEVAGSLISETPQPVVDPEGAIVLPGFDADLLYRFRLHSFGTHILLWAAIGVGFAPLADRVLARAGEPERDDAGRR